MIKSIHKFHLQDLEFDLGDLGIHPGEAKGVLHDGLIMELEFVTAHIPGIFAESVPFTFTHLIKDTSATWQYIYGEALKDYRASCVEQADHAYDSWKDRQMEERAEFFEPDGAA